MLTRYEAQVNVMSTPQAPSVHQSPRQSNRVLDFNSFLTGRFFRVHRLQDFFTWECYGGPLGWMRSLFRLNTLKDQEDFLQPLPLNQIHFPGIRFSRFSNRCTISKAKADCMWALRSRPKDTCYAVWYIAKHLDLSWHITCNAFRLGTRRDKRLLPCKKKVVESTPHHRYLQLQMY